MAILNPAVKASRSEMPFSSISVAQNFSSSSFCSSESVSSNSALFLDCLCCSSRYSRLSEIRVSCGLISPSYNSSIIFFIFIASCNHTRYHAKRRKSRKQTDNNLIKHFRGFESYWGINGVVLSFLFLGASRVQIFTQLRGIYFVVAGL